MHRYAQRHELHLRIVLSLLLFFVLFCCVLEGRVKDFREAADRVKLLPLIVQQLARTSSLALNVFLFSSRSLCISFLIIIQVEEDFSLEDALAGYRLLVHDYFYLSADRNDIKINSTNIQNQIKLYETLVG